MDTNLRLRKPCGTILMRPFVGLAAVFGLLLSSSVSSFAIAIQEITIEDIQFIQDINPNQSTLDPVNPLGASGGRVNGLASVAGDNQAFYAASEWGGLFKTVDKGVTWSRLDRHLPVATWDVEVDPVDTDIVYATSFYDGRVDSLAGINVSYDAGVTWTHPPSATPPTGLCSEDRRTEPSAFGIGIGVRPDASRTVVIGTNCGVAISIDSGNSWRFVDPTPGDPATNVWDVVVHEGIIDICGDDGHFRSTDGGQTWIGGTGLPGSTRPCSITVSPDESYVLFVVVGTLVFESDDAGVTWTNLGNPQPQGRIPFVVTNQRSDAGGNNRFDLWFADVQLFRANCTTPAIPAPGGANRCPASESWSNQQRGAHADGGDLVFDTEAANDACPMLYSNDGGVYRNTDLGPNCHTPNWEQPDVTPHALWLYAMAGADQPGVAAEDLYFGCQDNGSFAATNAGAARPTWVNRDCCDVFTIVADATRVVYDIFAPYSLMYGDPGMVNVQNVATLPPGCCPLFTFPDYLAQFGPNQYIAVTGSGAFITSDITANPVMWPQLGAASTPAGGFCGVQVAVSGGTPTFYAQTTCVGVFETQGPAQLWKFVGTDPAGVWEQVDDNDGLTGGFGIFAVDPRNPNRLYASNLAPTGPQMVFSNDGGDTWDNDAALDQLMTGGGVFKYQNQRGPTSFTEFVGYPQPSLVAFDPEDPNILVAGGRDSGVFLSTDRGKTWSLVTDPFDPGTSGIPHLPRPWFAYFDHEPAGELSLYIGTQGRGVWRLSSFTDRREEPRVSSSPLNPPQILAKSLQQLTSRNRKPSGGPYGP
jgi:photosystem II stability/assembly factor-like uncharacterized protein